MTSRDTATVGGFVIRLLEAYGVEVVFGIPGVHTLELYRGLEGSSIRHVLVRHEQGAGFAADGYARVTGKPGVCLLISGPGVTNAATPMGQAYSDSVPMIVISSTCSSASLGRGWGALHEVTDQRAASAPLTAFSRTAFSAEDVSDAMSQAFAVFSAGRPRPVHIEIPIDVLARSCNLKPAAAAPALPPVATTACLQAIDKMQRSSIALNASIPLVSISICKRIFSAPWIIRSVSMNSRDKAFASNTSTVLLPAPAIPINIIVSVSAITVRSVSRDLHHDRNSA